MSDTTTQQEREAELVRVVNKSDYLSVENVKTGEMLRCFSLRELGLAALYAEGFNDGRAALPQRDEPVADGIIDIARIFHDTYERLAPAYGYETRPDTKVFDQHSKNGRLMVATVKALRHLFATPPSPSLREVQADAKRWQMLVRMLCYGLRGAGHGRKFKLVEISPMYGDEEEVTSITTLIDAALARLEGGNP